MWKGIKKGRGKGEKEVSIREVRSELCRNAGGEPVELYETAGASRNLIFIAPRTATALKIKLSGIFKRGANRLMAARNLLTSPSDANCTLNYSFPSR